MRENFKGMWIPNFVWGYGLNSDQKIIYAEIHSLCKRFNNECTASDHHFATLIERSRISANKDVQILKEKKLITIKKVKKNGKIQRIIQIW